MSAVGRLFWKIFFAFWLAMLVIAAGTGAAVHLSMQERLASMSQLAKGPQADFAVSAIAAALRHGGKVAVRSLFQEWPGRRPPVLIVDASGQDLFERVVPAEALARARQRLAGSARHPGVRQVMAPNGHDYLLFIPTDNVARAARRHQSFMTGDSLRLQLIIMLLASLAFSAGLAWYLTRPVRHLRAATRRLAAGDLAARVLPSLGGRRDEIADLGRDFDHMAERLQAVMGAQKRLLHDVSHELRSPLARLQVAIGLARQQPDKLAGTLERIERESGRLDELVGELLTLSRLEAGVRQGPPAELDVGELLAGIVEDAAFEARAEGSEVTLTVRDEAVVPGHAELLRRAFENVIRNGVKYAPPGSAVAVSLERDTARRCLVIEVCDHGPGVSEGELSTLFEPFVRVGDQATGARQGYGLGLAIAKRAIEAQGGSIQARNRAQGGLCVEMRLPDNRGAEGRG